MKHLLFLSILFLLSVTFSARDVPNTRIKSEKTSGVPKQIMPICRFTKWFYTGKTKMENEYGDTTQAVSERSVQQEPL